VASVEKRAVTCPASGGPSATPPPCVTTHHLHLIASSALQARSGWACTVLVDVVASERHSAALRARAVHELRAAAVRVTSQLRASQMLSIAYTLQWALSHHLGEGGAASSSSSELDAQPGEQRGRTEDIRSWSCLLLLRADLEVKALPLPHPAALGCRLRVPFETLDGRGVAGAAHLARTASAHPSLR